MAPSGQIFFAPFEFSFLYGSEVIFNLWDALALREVALCTGTVEWGDSQN